MPLLGLAGMSALFAAIIWSALRKEGGWVQLNRSRRGLEAAHSCTPWRDLPTLYRSWFFGLPVVVAIAVTTAVAGVTAMIAG